MKVFLLSKWIKSDCGNSSPSPPGGLPLHDAALLLDDRPAQPRWLHRKLDGGQGAALLLAVGSVLPTGVLYGILYYLNVHFAGAISGGFLPLIQIEI